MSLPENKPVIILLGPTAVGKTGVSILLAKALKTEIISADSMLVYKYMDIGTAKPSAKELAEIPHHLINILSPDETFSAGMFKEKATAIINELHRRNKIPVMAGGTGLYIRALTRGLFTGPTADWSIREQLESDAQLLGKDLLYERLLAVDSEAAKKIDPHDSRRIIRALEVVMKGDKTISELRLRSTASEPYDFIKIGLTRERGELYRLIDERVDHMIERGLVQETERLLTMSPGRTALQAIGYKEMLLFIRKEVSFDEAVRLIKKRSRMYAKRQFTWFRKEPGITWVDITGMAHGKIIFDKVINDIAILKNLIYS